MKRILFGGPEEGDSHKDLVARLDDLYDVHYVQDAVSMLWELGTVRLSVDKHARPYDLVMYDTRLFWWNATMRRRADLFCSCVVYYLGLPKKPVIILADDKIDEFIRDCSHKAGFIHVGDDPYKVDAVLDAVHAALYPNV